MGCTSCQNVPRQSDNWDDTLEFITKNKGKRIPGFPFNTKFPRMYMGKKYTIILVSGDTLVASVSDAREFSSEGLQWKTSEGTKDSAVVAAWKLIE